MAHPHQEHREHHVAKSRVHHITRGYRHGGAVAHGDEVEDVKLIRKTVKPGALKKRAAGGRIQGRAAGGRLDRPGRKRKGDTHVNIMVGGQQQPASPPPVPVPAGAAPVPPPRPPMPPMGAVPGMPPAVPPPGMPMRAKGGRIKDGPAWREGLRNGTQVQHNPGGTTDAANLAAHRNIKKVRTYRTGGKVERPPITGSAEGRRNPFPKMRHAAGGGLGRLEKARKARHGVAP